MKKITCFFLLFISININAQNLWVKVDEKIQIKHNVQTITKPIYKLNIEQLKGILKEVTVDRFHIDNSSVTLAFPNINGSLINFKIAEASVMAPELQEKYPSIRSYIGRSIDKTNTIVRFSISPHEGLHASFLPPGALPYYIKKADSNYVVTNKLDDVETIKCGVIDEDFDTFPTDLMRSSSLVGGNFRTYRLALATTGEFSQHYLNQTGTNTGTDADKKAVILGRLNTLMTAVNAVYENEFALTMQLVANNENIIFLDPATDPYSSTNKETVMSENGAVCVNNIGGANYDIGHVIYSGGGGVALLGTVCSNQYVKARGCSGNYASTIMHEIGHQFGASHTFNFIPPNGIDQLHTGSSVEVHAGHTIMSYGSGPDIFHAISIAQIKSRILNHSCPTIINNGNTPPTANAGLDYTIPKSTAFVLEGTANDPDGTVLTYTWEQMDNGNAPDDFPVNESGPVFTWLAPSTDIKRYFPDMNTILVGYTMNIASQEAVPPNARDLNFTFLVRDNDVRGGETASDNITVTVDDTAGPFMITSHNDIDTWYAGSTKTLTWEVANTDAGSVNTPTVDIYFSTDNGENFSNLIASEIPNNGRYELQVPFGIATTQGRYMIRGHNNIFFDVNDAKITVKEKDFLINITPDEKIKELCLNNGNSVSYNFTYNAYNNFNNTVTFSANALSGTTITFSPTSSNTDNTTVTMSINNINSNNVGSNTIEITATSGGVSFTEKVILKVFNGSINPVNLSLPANGTLPVTKPYTFEWQQNNTASEYIIEIATDNAFTNVVVNDTITTNTFTTSLLDYNTQYYWHVKPINTCIDGNFSNIYSFTTQQEGIYIPDDIFEQLVEPIGTLDNYVSEEIVLNITELGFSNSIGQPFGVTDLTGLKYFTSLTALNIKNNHVGSINISNNRLLTTFNCENSQLSQLNVTKNPLIVSLNCSNNNLSELDVTQNSQLEYLGIRDNNLTELDVSHNKMLKVLRCNNNDLTSINVDNNVNLNTFYISFNNLTNLSLVNNINLVYFGCEYNNITSLSLGDNSLLKRLFCNNNNIASLNLLNTSALKELNCKNNDIINLDLSNTPLLEELNCKYNNITSLNITSNPLLTKLNCLSNNLTELDLRNGNNTAITDFDIRYNYGLDCVYVDDAAWSEANWTNISGVATFVNNETECNAHYTNIPDNNFEQALVDLYIDTNPVLDNKVFTPRISGRTDLDVHSKNISDLTGIEDFESLTRLYCYDNNLTSLDLSNNLLLNNLAVFNNQLTSLDLSSNHAITRLSCEYNQMTTLDLRNRTNGPSFDYFDARHNPNLTCIYVDDAAWSTANIWQIDPASTFVETESECAALNVDDYDLSTKFNIYPNTTANYFIIDTQEQIKTVSIYNMLGQEVKHFGLQKKYDLSNLSNGIYYIIIRTKNGIGYKEIIKKQL